MKLYKYVFLILHYYTIEDTKKCIDTVFEKGKGKNIEIVIVDNASKNNTGEELKKIYMNRRDIHIIINEENLGFARGNNVGFKYIKEKLNPDFIIMCNNDTFLLQDIFFDLIEKEYMVSNFAVLGPQIILPGNKVQPVTIELPNISVVKKQLRDIKLDYLTNVLGINMFYKFFRELLKNILIKMKFKSINLKIENDIKKRYENIVLHGSFLIFSKKYIEKFDGLDNRTFLYREEELLALRLKNSSLNSVYNPEIQIFHNEDSSTNAITKSKRAKRIFVDKNLIKSTKVLINEMKN